MIKQIFGIILIIAGIIALFLPIIPGGILVYLGFELLGITLLKDKIILLREKIKKRVR